MYDTKKPIATIADLKGMKVRVMGNPMFVEMMNALGGNGIAMGYQRFSFWVVAVLRVGSVAFWVFTGPEAGVVRRRWFRVGGPMMETPHRLSAPGSC